MKQIKVIPQVKCKIEVLEVETKHLTSKKNAKHSQKAGYFLELSHKWLMAYSYLNEVALEMTNEEYKKYYEKLMFLRDKMTDYAILNR